MAETSTTTPLKVVGVAILPKKVLGDMIGTQSAVVGMDTHGTTTQAAKHLHDNLLAKARAAGILVKPIDLTQPLDVQGPFSLILHKIRNNPGMFMDAGGGHPTMCAKTLYTLAHAMHRSFYTDFEQQLRDYHAKHPHVRVLDDMDAIQPLFNRATMLDPVQGEGIVVEVCCISGCIIVTCDDDDDDDDDGGGGGILCSIWDDNSLGIYCSSGTAVIISSSCPPPTGT